MLEPFVVSDTQDESPIDMKVEHSTRERIIEPCTLEDFNYHIDPYVGCGHRCKYCYTQNQSEFDWENQIGIYPNIKERLAEKLSSLSPQVIYIGMNTDPYQPLEKGYEQTRIVLELLKERDFSVCILTKSNLVTRDIDLLKEMDRASVGVSIAFQDDLVRRLFEENTIPNWDRIRTISRLKEEGIETYVLISPVMPYITETPSLIDEALPYADTIWIYPLEIESEEDKNWQKIQPILKQYFPEIAGRLKEVIFTADHPYWRKLRLQLENIRVKDNINLKVHI